MREVLILSPPMGIGRKSVDLGIAFVKRSVLALEFEQEGLEFAAFSGPANFGDKLLVVKRDFSNLTSAREWIFGDAQEKKASPGPVIELKQSSGAAAFSLTHAQISEAASCFRRLEGLASLNEAVSYFLKHANPAGGNGRWNRLPRNFSEHGPRWEFVRER